MFKNAGIKSIREAQDRLHDGEVFWRYTTKFIYDEDFILSGESPYRYNAERKFLTSDAINCDWGYCTDWCVEVEEQWFDNIPAEGTLCWVSNEIGVTRNRAKLITEYNAGMPMPFKANGVAYSFAAPIKPEDLG